MTSMEYEEYKKARAELLHDLCSRITDQMKASGLTVAEAMAVLREISSLADKCRFT